MNVPASLIHSDGSAVDLLTFVHVGDGQFRTTEPFVLRTGDMVDLGGAVALVVNEPAYVEAGTTLDLADID